MIKKELKNSNTLITEFSSKEFSQTDFGYIYFNLPKETTFPKSTFELAMSLKLYNKKRQPIKIRNTGHSMNGQTLTDGVQVNVGNIKKLHFDEEKMEVTVGCGNTWDEVLKAIEFPKYCLPVFPNNPGQQIKIGGTAAVGGISPYSSSAGGLWNHVVRARLVTMTGEIIECSRKKNFELLKYSLGGFGRIGVLAELTYKVVPSKKHVLVSLLTYSDFDKHFVNIQEALKMGYSAVFAFNEFSDNALNKVSPFITMIGVETDSKAQAERIDEQIKKYHENWHFYLKKVNKKEKQVTFNFKSRLFSKKDFVYYYPEFNKVDQLELCHPWSDYCLNKEHYPIFIKESRKIFDKYGLAQYAAKQAAWHNVVEVETNTTYCIRKLSKTDEDFFPLTLDFKDADFSFSFGVALNVPHSEIKKSFKLHDELTKLVFDLNGKKYLYGYHRLTKLQVEKQFGRDIIQKWQKIKDELDPKHLLNIGVIEHLD